jgi:hypothetical protein
MEAVVAPVLHKNDVPPEAVIVFEPPGQMDKLPHTMLHTGGVLSKLTVTSAKQLSFAFSGLRITKR